MRRVAILGAGAWASAMAQVLSDENTVRLYARRAAVCQEINEEGTNRRYLPELRFRETVSASQDLETVLEGADLVLHAIPTQSTRTVLQKIRPILRREVPLVNLSKGLEQSTGLRISQIVEEVLPGQTFAVLSGPSHAEEVIRNDPTTVIVAAKSLTLAQSLQGLFMRPFFRVYTGEDLLGVELGGAVKNILALGMGMVDGLGYGDNARAALLTRGIHELVRFGTALGAQPRTLYGLAGLGDLYVTATSRHSRNRRAGELLGQGVSLQDAEQMIGQTVEGVKTCRAVYAIAKQRSVDMPIVEGLYGALYQQRPFPDVVREWMSRERKQEFED